VIDIETVARALLLAYACQSAIKAIAKPIERDTHDDRQQSVSVVTRQRIKNSGSDLCRQTQYRELIGCQSCGCMFRHPDKGALFDRGGQGAIDSLRSLESRFFIRACEGRIHRVVLSKIYFLSASEVERKVNSSDSRGTLSTNGPTTQPSPVGMARVSEADSICI